MKMRETFSNYVVDNYVVNGSLDADYVKYIPPSIIDFIYDYSFKGNSLESECLVKANGHYENAAINFSNYTINGYDWDTINAKYK